VSSLSNGGKKVVPQIARPRVERSAFTPQIQRTVNLPQHSIEGVLPGMIGAAEFGTAHRGVDASMGVAGKTGSCIAKGSWVGLFASVAPVEDPKYSVVVITRGQSERGKYAAAIAGKVYQELGGQIKRNRDLLYARHLKVKPVFENGAAAEAERSFQGMPNTARRISLRLPLSLSACLSLKRSTCPRIPCGLALCLLQLFFFQALRNIEASDLHAFAAPGE